MGNLGLWFSMGLEHILDWQGYDHICYILVLSIVFPLNEWKKLLLLITAFTLGHSLTLALSVFDIIRPPQLLIEVLIPVTIMLTCLLNIARRNKPTSNVLPHYLLAAFFGLIHGMAFSYLLKSMLGREVNVVGPLFGFNIGLEIGQLVIVVAVLLISLILERLFRVQKRDYLFFVSAAIFGVASKLLIDRILE